MSDLKTYDSVSGKVLSQYERQLVTQHTRPINEYDYSVNASPEKAHDMKFFQALLKIDLPESVLSEVEKASKDIRITKRFQHREPMMQTCKMFTDVKCRKSVMYTAEARAATVLLEKYILPSSRKFSRYDYHRNWEVLLSNKDGAAGLVFDGTKAENIDALIKMADKIRSKIQHCKSLSEVTIPAKCFHRAQISEYIDENGKVNGDNIKYKDRMVMGLDGATVLVEASHGYALYNLMKNHMDNYAGGKEPTTLRHLIRSWKRGYYWMSVDYSKFDMHLPAEVLHHVFDIIIRKYVKSEHEREWRWIEHNFIYTQCETPDGRFFFKEQGVPSGSYFTQPIGTISNIFMLLCGICHHARRYRCDSPHLMIDWVLKHFRPLGQPHGTIAIIGMGDDSLSFCDLPFNDDFRNDVGYFISREFGVSVSPTKSEHGGPRNYPEFLKRQWRENGEWQNLVQVLVNVMAWERVRTYKGYEPIHIIWGLFYTYRSAFLEAGITEAKILSQMVSSKYGIDALKLIPQNDLPGVIRGFGHNVRETMYRDVRRKVKALGLIA